MRKPIRHLHKILSNPKSTLPIFAIAIVVLTIFLYTRIGHAPVVPQSIEVSNTTPIIASGSNVALSFPKSGRVESVMVKVGDNIKAGQVLAKLSAPDALGAVSQAKGALDLAQAQYASLNLEYANTQKQQDLIVESARKTLLSSSLEGAPSVQDSPNIPIISGTYTCDNTGSYALKPYSSNDNDSGYSMNYSGIESGTVPVKYNNPVPLGSCGLQVKFTHVANFSPLIIWTIAIPNTKSSVYLTNKNSYDLAVSNREKTLADLASKIGSGTATDNSVAKAQVDAALGAYQAALGAYQNNIISAATDGIVNFVDPDLKAGQSVTAGKPVISISAK